MIFISVLGSRHCCQIKHLFRFYGLNPQVCTKPVLKQLEFCKTLTVRGAILWPAGCDGQFLAKTSLLRLHRGRLILHLYIFSSFSEQLIVKKFNKEIRSHHKISILAAIFSCTVSSIPTLGIVVTAGIK